MDRTKFLIGAVGSGAALASGRLAAPARAAGIGGFYERVLGFDPEVYGPKISTQFLNAALGEFGRGKITPAQLQEVIVYSSGAPLNAAEIADVTTLLSTVNGSGASKLARVKEIEDVLNLADATCPYYATVAQVKSKLGV